jgi:UDP:flavonoid glycosyltransferase YjiC (YdhE family)
MTSILLASTPVHGHITPVLALSRHLVAAGHRVRFLTGARYRWAVEATGATYLALPAGADYDDRDIDAAFPGRRGLRGLARLRFDVDAVFLQPVPAQLAALDEAVRAEHTYVVVTETLFAAAAPFALRPRDERPAVVSLGVIPLGIPDADLAPFGFGMKPTKGPVGRARNSMLMWLAENLVFAGLRRSAHEVLARVGARVPSSPREAIGCFDAIAQATVPGFEYPRRDLPANVTFVGPLTGPQPRAGDHPDWWGDLASAHRVVHVTQGTVANRDYGELISPTLAALADEDVLVVVSTGGRSVEELGALPGNARAAEFLAYDDLLPYVDVLVTNGGYGGVQHALRRGIPIVTSGTSEDKAEVGARVSWARVGISLRTSRPSAFRIRRAVRAVLADERFARRSARLARQYEIASGAAGVEAILLSVTGASVGIRQ